MPKPSGPDNSSGVPGQSLPEEANRLLEVLVAQAMDDLDEGRFSLEHALRMIGYLAWAAGFDNGNRGVIYRGERT